jgi:PHP family Zn ribbon phosphoesterase
MKKFKADLHIHSCLSPCADLDMSPRAIVEKCLERGVDIIGVCDHNTAENVGAVMRAGARRGLYVLPGMEINSREEVHTLAIFDSESQALAMQELIYAHLKGTNRPELFGDQVVANEFDEVEGFNDRMLIGATQLGLDEVIREVHRLGGLSIASHVDRPSFSVLSQLGFIPPDHEFDALEVSGRVNKDSIRSEIPEVAEFPILTFSDAHFLDDIGRPYTTLVLEFPNLDEIRMALAEKGGRGVELS